MPDKDVRVHLIADGFDRGKRDIEDFNAEADKAGKKNIRPKLSVDGLKTTRIDLARAGVSMDKLGAKKVSPSVGLSDERFKATMDSISKRLDVFGRKRAAATAELKDEAAKAKLIKLELKMDDLSDKVAKPSIDLHGARSALAEIMLINHEMDKLSGKAARISVTEHASKGFLGRVRGIFGGGGGGGLSGLFGGGGGGDAAAGAAAGDAGKSGGGIFSTIFGSGGGLIGSSPGTVIGIGALATYAASLAPALITMGVALGPTLGGAILAGMSKNSKGKMTGPLVEFAKDMRGVLTEAVDPIRKVLPGLMSKLGELIRHLPLKQMFSATIPVLRMVFDLMGKAAKIVVPMLTNALKEIRPVLPQMEQGFVMLIRAVADFVRDLGPGIKPSAQIFLVSTKLIDWVLRGLANVCNFVAKSVVDTGHAIRVAWDAAARIAKDIWSAFGKFMTNATLTLTRDIPRWWRNCWNFVKNSFVAFWHDCVSFAKGLWHDLVQIFDWIKTGVSRAWDACFNAVRDFFVSFWHDVVTAAKDFWHGIVGIWDDIKNGVTRAWDDCFSAVKSFFRDVANTISGWAKDFWHGLTDIWHSISRDVTRIWDDLWNWAHDRFHSLTSGVEGLATGLWHGVVNTFRSLGKDVSSVFGATWREVKRLADDGAGWVVDALNGLGKAWNAIAGFLHLPKVPSIPMPHFATGGRVDGTGNGDIVHAMLTPGEVVIPRHMVTAGAIDHLRGNLPGFAHGGQVGDSGGRGNLGRGHLKGPGTLRGNAGARMEAGSISFGGLVSDVLSIGRKALTAPAVLAIHAAEAAANKIAIPWVTEEFDALANGLISRLEGSISKAESAAGSGGIDVIPNWFRKTFRHDPYKWGGNSTTSGADCSGATLLTYKHFGIADGMPRTAASQYDWSNKISQPVPGALVFLKGSDGTNDRSGAGHVGIAVNGSTYMSEYDTQTGFREGSYQEPHTFGLPRGWSKDRFMKKFVTGMNGGPVPVSMMNIARWLNSHGLTKAAAAGICGCIAGESGGNPESVGSRGGGLIGWTPITSAYPFRDIVTHHPAKDLGHQLVDIIAYIKRNGSIRDMNSFRNPVAAADHFSRVYERPAVALSDVRPSVAQSVYKRLANGGWITEPMIGMGLNTGHMFTLGEKEAEYITPASKMGGSHGGQGGDTILVQIECGVGDAHKIGQEVEQVLTKYGQRTGKKLQLWTK